MRPHLSPIGAAVPLTDALGGMNAINLAITGNNFSGSLATAGLSPDRPVWVEFDLAVGDSDSLSSLKVRLADGGVSSTGAGNHLDLDVNPKVGWFIYRFLTQTPNSAAPLYLIFGRSADDT